MAASAKTKKPVSDAPALNTQAPGEAVSLQTATSEATTSQAALGPLSGNAGAIDTILRTVLFPLAAPYFATERARAYLAETFARELAAGTENVPSAQIVAPRPLIAGPILQGLAFAYEEPSLRALYVGLLSTAMDSRTAAGAHPAFAEIIRQLSPEDAQLIDVILRVSKLPMVELTLATKGQPGFQAGLRHLVDLKVGGNIAVSARLPGMIQNWARLGLAEIDYSQKLTRVDAYDWVTTRPEYFDLTRRLGAQQSIVITTGVLRRTTLGQQFGEAIGLFTPTA